MEFYGLDYSIKSFAVANEFVVNTNKVCYTLGKAFQPFGICISDLQKQYGVLDFATFGGFVSDVSLMDEITELRKGVFKDAGIIVDTSDEVKKKLLLYDYLMSVSICYVEIPKYITKNGYATPTFDKFLCTRNPAIMAAWMGSTPAEMQAKYSARIMSRQVEFNENTIRCVKLNHSSKGNSITLPRNAFKIEHMTCIPLYMLYAFMSGFRPALDTGILKFSFAKDNGTVRELCSTLSESVIREYYDDNVFINTILSGVDIDSVQQGGMNLGSKMHRGYVKIPELGTSVYDATGCRSLNLARILKVEQISEVDRTFIKVDLDSVLANFDVSLDYLVKNNEQMLRPCYNALLGEEADNARASTTAQMVSECKEYVRGRSAFLSTTYLRSLHMFLISHPDWFPLYTGKPAQTVTSSANFGVETMDF